MTTRPTRTILKLFLLGALCPLLGIAGCGSDGIQIDPPLPLPQAPQIADNSEAGFLVFRLTPDGTTSDSSLFFVNGGQDDLVISDISVEGSTRFSVVSAEPMDQIAASRAGVLVSVRFSPNQRGVELGTLVVTSNAENVPVNRIELLGPASSNPTPFGPDVVAFESSIDFQSVQFSDVPLGFVRLYNLGGRAAFITGYELINNTDDAFVFPSGTATPGAPCVPGAAACGAGGLQCGPIPGSGSPDTFCEPLALGTGLAGFLVVVVNYEPATPGTRTATARTVVIDPLDVADPPVETNIDVLLNASN